MTSLATRLFVLMTSIVAFASLVGAQAREVPYYQGDQREIFLKEAEITDMTATETGITRPRKTTLETAELTHFALFKTVDIFRRGPSRLGDGTVEVDFQDSWKTEVAAYELDKMIGLGMVPATVERRHNRDQGSMQWWIDGAMSELDRVERGTPPPDSAAWNDMVFKMRVFDALIYNVDRNGRNMLVTPNWHICLIDHSRSFRRLEGLREREGLLRFSRSLLDGIRRLDEDMLKERLEDYLTIYQIQAILVRRDLILERADELVAERGEDRVLYD